MIQHIRNRHVVLKDGRANEDAALNLIQED